MLNNASIASLHGGAEAAAPVPVLARSSETSRPRLVDIHAHLVPQVFPPLPPGVPASEWPAMVALEDGRASMLIDGQPFRIFEPSYWDMAGRIAEMDREGVDLQVISPLPELLGYWLAPSTAAAMAQHLHRTIADAVASAPTRLAGLGMAPLQDIPLALEAIDQIAGYGLRGILVASNVNGVSVADARFDPVFARCEALNLAILVHGYRPAGSERLLGSPLLGPIVGVPQDTAAAVASFIATDVLGRFPDLRLGFAHGGGSFGAVLDRMDHVWREFPQMRQTCPIAPRDYVRRFFFDTVTFSPDYLRYLTTAFGVETLMAGSDGPTPIGQRGLGRFVEAACAGDPEAAEKIKASNALRFLALDPAIADRAAAAA